MLIYILFIYRTGFREAKLLKKNKRKLAGNKPEFLIITHKILTWRFHYYNDSIMPVRQISIKMNSFVETRHQHGHTLAQFLKEIYRKVTHNQSSGNKQKGNTASYLLCTLFTHPVTGRQMS